MRVFLDDKREAPTKNERTGEPLQKWDAVCRHADQAIALLKQGKVTFISLDYYMQSGEMNGLDVAIFILKGAMSCELDRLHWACHSASSNGFDQINTIMSAADFAWNS